jgi:hypothetical protein
MRIERLSDSNGLKPGQLIATRNQWRWLRYEPFTGSQKRLEQIQLYRYRQGPVPGIHRRKKRRWFRHPRTTSERRANSATRTTKETVEYHGVVLKLRRKRRKLPSAYDDLFVDRQRSWKKHRRTQQKRLDNIDRRMHSPPIWVRETSGGLSRDLHLK